MSIQGGTRSKSGHAREFSIRISLPPQGSLPESGRLHGQPIVGRGYFYCTVGVVTEERVKRYIDDQDAPPQRFKVWDEEQTALQAEPAFRPKAKPSPKARVVNLIGPEPSSSVEISLLQIIPVV
jgi:hypothetical protein